MSHQLQPGTIVARQSALQDNKFLRNILSGKPIRFSSSGKLARHRFEYLRGMPSPDQTVISMITL